MEPRRLIAMWSGPRNISTAMMRSWSSRTDTAVIDEPFYACFLEKTRRPDPGFDAIVSSQSTHWQTVVEQITSGILSDSPVIYQKHMTTHMVPELSLDWLDQLSHCFLIRDPELVVASYTHKRPDASIEDFGFQQQFRLFEHVVQHLESQPPVIDTERFLQNPAAQQAAVCQKLGLEFQSQMLSWESGSRETDGVWESYWYDAVKQSTGFKPYQPAEVSLTPDQQAMADQCRPYYERMREFVIVTD